MASIYNSNPEKADTKGSLRLAGGPAWFTQRRPNLGETGSQNKISMPRKAMNKEAPELRNAKLNKDIPL